MITGLAALAILALLLVVVRGFDDIFGVYWSSGGTPISVRETSTGDSRVEADFTIATSTTDQEQQFGFDVANLKGLCITVSGNTGGTVVLETNSGSSPGHTFTFPAGGGEMIWSSRSPQANPFGSTDVTSTFWTNNGSATATVKFRALLNS